MKVYPLAIYTADHGLSWTYPRSEISFSDLDACRKAFGPLPDFDAGAKGFEGVWANGSRVYVIRCQSVKAWDFRGRNATYLAVTWIPRSDAATTDFAKLLASQALTTPTKTPPSFFESNASSPARAPIQDEPFLSDGFARAGAIISGTPTESTVAIKRVDGNMQASCSVFGIRADITHSVTPNERTQNSTTPASSSANLVPIIIIISILLFLMAAGVAILGLKWLSERSENAELRQENAKLRQLICEQKLELDYYSNPTNSIMPLPMSPAVIRHNIFVSPFMAHPYEGFIIHSYEVK